MLHAGPVLQGVPKVRRICLFFASPCTVMIHSCGGHPPSKHKPEKTDRLGEGVQFQPRQHTRTLKLKCDPCVYVCGLMGLMELPLRYYPGCVWVLSVREPTRTVSDTLWGLVHRKADCTSRRVYSTFMDSILYNGIRGFIYYYLFTNCN